jgi:hypothetical protein
MIGFLTSHLLLPESSGRGLAAIAFGVIAFLCSGIASAKLRQLALPPQKRTPSASMVGVARLFLS